MTVTINKTVLIEGDGNRATEPVEHTLESLFGKYEKNTLIGPDGNPTAEAIAMRGK